MESIHKFSPPLHSWSCYQVIQHHGTWKMKDKAAQSICWPRCVLSDLEANLFDVDSASASHSSHSIGLNHPDLYRNNTSYTTHNTLHIGVAGGFGIHRETVIKGFSCLRGEEKM